MMRSMFSAVSGLRNHQTYMDVVGNNIANINTTGFRASRVSFQDVFSQTLRQASGPLGNRGGVNPLQVGLGVNLASVSMVQSQGNLQATSKLTDLALEGDGHFILSDGNRWYYTRDGAFDRSIDGTLVSPVRGLKVMGWQAVDGAIDKAKALSALNIPLGVGMKAYASRDLQVSGNLSAQAAAGDKVEAEGNFIDSLGRSHALRVTLTRTAGSSTWTWQVASPEGLTVTPNTPTTITFDVNGTIVPPTTAPTVSFALTNGATSPAELTLDLTALTQLDATSEILATTDGAQAGYLATFSIDNDGIITGIYSNGVRDIIGQIALATFANSNGLLRSGGNLLEASANSGAPQIGTAGVGGRARVASGFLEMSNVDMAQEFTSMIMAERGFQANSRVISASDEVLRDLVNLIR